jgi:arylsulfatase A-like enzyme
MKNMTKVYVGAAALLLSSTGFAKKSERPNILFIMSDDHAYQAISAYGTGLNQTPNIDRLAKEGAIFKKGFVTNSICAPSRATMLTGKFSHLNGKVDNRLPFNWNQQNFAKILQQNGYQTALIGKIHLEGDPQGFNYWNVLPGQGVYYNPDFIENGVKKRIEGYVTTITTQIALDWLDKKRDKSQPFCLLYHQKAPHRNWLPEEKYMNLFEDREFPFPDNFFDNFDGRGTAAHTQEMGIVKDMMWGHDMKFENDPYTGAPTNLAPQLKRMNEAQLKAWRNAYNPRNEAFLKIKPTGRALAKWKYQRYIRDYLKCVQSVDDGVGQVLDYLDKNGLTENTIVVYTSDQGFYLGEHGWFDKRFMYEESLRTPILMRYPKEIKAGSVVEKMVQNLDFAPTFLDYAGVEAPKDMQGVSFKKLVAGKRVNWHDAIYYHYYEFPGEHKVKRHYGIRTERYKLIHFYYDLDEWELYDLEKDPHEMKSVYNDPDYSGIQEELHRKLNELRKQYKDSDQLDQVYISKSVLPRK